MDENEEECLFERVKELEKKLDHLELCWEQFCENWKAVIEELKEKDGTEK